MLPERAAYRLFCCPGFPKGCPLWHTTLLAKCSVLYLLAWLTGETGCGASCAPFAPAGKQAEFLWMGMNKKSGWFQRTAAGIWKPRPSSYAPTCGQNVPKLWPHSRKSSRTAGNRQGWNERFYTRPWPPPSVPLNGQTRRPIPQSACPRSFWFWGIQFFKIE